MENLIKWVYADTLQCTNIVEDGEEIIGHLRAEVGEEAVMVHIMTYRFTKSSLKLFKKSLQELLYYLKTTYNYEHWYSLTDNLKLVNIMTEGKAYPIQKIEGYTLYECEL
jgi:hypothetical protein